MTIISSPWPKFTYGFTNNLNYKNFDLSFLLTGSYGNKILTFYENWMTNLDGVFNVLANVTHRWKSEADPGDGYYGSVQSGTTYLERDRWSSRYLKDGSYMSVKNITLGYKLNLRNDKYNLRIYASVQNAFIFTKYPGTNPEVDAETSSTTSQLGTLSTSGTSPGIDSNSYPIPRTITFGVNIGF